MIKEIQVKEITRRFNNRFTLSCSLSLKAGKTYVLMGPNGSGKSTLLKMIALIERPDSGDIIYNISSDEALNPFSDIELRRRVVLVSTKPVVFKESVMRNVIYGLRIRGIGRKDAELRAEKALERVKLLNMKDQMATVLSSGEKQRMSLARAIAIDPDVLMLDEPTVNLDPENTRIIEESITGLHSKGDRIILFVTHNIFQAKKLADEVIFMYNGRVIEQGKKDDFFNLPRTEVARKYLKGEIY